MKIIRAIDGGIEFGYNWDSNLKNATRFGL
jgi:hypothetical protein